MLPEQEQIPVSVDDLQELNKFGIHIADLTDLIHDTVRNFRAERCDALSAQPSGLTLAERE
ncbi:hypothetical protein, partial [Marinobacter gelidimuriae]|uniref:hypothetical protein n=1 Tax=Marinobacter gelidimuriae TaxID=2739064 RepID=UPI0004779617